MPYRVALEDLVVVLDQTSIVNETLWRILGDRSLPMSYVPRNFCLPTARTREYVRLMIKFGAKAP